MLQSSEDYEAESRTSHQLRDLIPALIDRLQHHNCYYELFQTFFDSITHDFYFAESAQLRKSLTAKKFLTHAEERSKEEDQRARKLFPDATRELILRTMDKALYFEQLEWIAGEALPQFMEKQSPDALLLMYNKFSRVDGLKVLQVSFKKYVKEQVAIIVKDVAKEEKMVENLLQFKYFCDSLTADAFANVEPVTTVKSIAPSVASTSALPMDVDVDTAPPKKIPNQEFVYALSDAFQQGFKARRNKPAEMIAKYLDKAMRKGQKGKEEVDFMSELDRVLTLYRYTDDKDVFRTFYHRALAKRLLLEKSASDDFEKMILKKLKEEYDPEFGMGDHMFKDLELSRGLMKEYTEHRERQGEESTQQKMSVMVLQRSFWPFTTRKEDADIPAWMQEDLRRYVLFYKTKHQGHKLDWDHSLGTASLRARFKAAEKELSVSLYQAVVLLLFNEAEQIPFAEIKSQIRMEDAELRRTLQSLACGKKRVLKKLPAGKDVNDEDVFHFNLDFTDPQFRVHINSIQVKETPEESKRTQTLIEGDRRYALDAAIVRIMKGKKELQYEQLKTATIDAVKNHFVPDVTSIKQRIDSLVEQDYLRRHDDDMHLLVYVA
ncbi:hypothetical protein EW026_g5599 [Hermanssonia centrifuga]|uniref:Cullin family profile domain-containing protein n=1 Tax=Hermanssonia centrifuga TaxID=98765 RepID=A0A4S4KI12_9APHY|nr:hypothetical protein EW026_g5599 [Hermanssonia centrifuga]